MKLLFEVEVSDAQMADECADGRRAPSRPAASPGRPLTLTLTHSKSRAALGNLECDLVLSATGRRAVSDTLGLEDAGVATRANGDVVVDSSLVSSLEGVYAAGDVIGAPQLASTGISQAEAAVDAMFGRPAADLRGDSASFATQPAVQLDVSPAALLSSTARYPIGIWTIPELAFVGLTAAAATAPPHSLRVVEGVGRYSASIRGHVHTVGTTREGEYLIPCASAEPAPADADTDADADAPTPLTGPALKLVVEREAPHVVVGVHIFGDDACELIHFGTTLVQERKCLADILALCFAAVTYHELYKLAALDAIRRIQCGAWRELYRTLDADGDGELTRDEVTRRLGAMCDANQVDDVVRALFKGSGGSVDIETFVKRAQKLRSTLQVDLVESSVGSSTEDDYLRLS